MGSNDHASRHEGNGEHPAGTMGGGEHTSRHKGTELLSLVSSDNIKYPMEADKMKDLPPPINTMFHLGKMKQPKGQGWAVFVYYLNRDIILPSGEIDDLYGLLFCMGSYPTQEEAIKRAKSIIQETSSLGVHVAKLGLGFRLTREPQKEITSFVRLERESLSKKAHASAEARDLIRLQKQERKEEEARYRLQEEIEKEIADEVIEERDPEHPEYFRLQCYSAVRNYQRIEDLKSQLVRLEKCYADRREKAREYYLKHPEEEKVWLDNLGKKLGKRGEYQLFESIAQTYINIKEDLFSL